MTHRSLDVAGCTNCRSQCSTQEDYLQLPTQAREKLRSDLLAIPQSWSAQASNPVIENYEGQQAPLYYLVAAPVLRAASELTLPGQVFVLRLFGLLLACATLPIGYLLLRHVFADDMVALLATALVVAMPELTCRRQPRLERTFGDLAVHGSTAAGRQVHAVGPPSGLRSCNCADSGIGASRQSLFPRLPAGTRVCAVDVSLASRWLALHLLVAGAMVAVVAGPWYWHIHRASGSWSARRTMPQYADSRGWHFWRKPCTSTGEAGSLPSFCRMSGLAAGAFCVFRR